jgi:primosomal protein N' (replication factor Y)
MFIEVLLDQAIDKPLDYTVSDLIPFGTRVKVPLRGGSCLGTVVGMKQEGNPKALPVLEVLQDAIVTQEQYQLAQFMSHYYCTPLQKILVMMLPSGVRHNTQEKKIHVIRLNVSKPKAAEFAALARSKAPKQAEILDLFLENPSKKPLSTFTTSKSSLTTLIKKGILAMEEESGSLLSDVEFFPVKPKNLSQEQLLAKETIEKSLGRFSVHLLFGVTGSGKSEVYFQLMQKVREMGQGVLFLVPEIALTQQLMDKLKTRFGKDIALLHHKISDGEKNSEWLKLSSKEKNICVGARSAVFAPIQNLGLVIVDEEHEASYKQGDEMPCYNARDLSIMRAKFENACCVLGSATPSLESYTHALSGKYHLSLLTSRPTSMILPTVKIVDMAKEYDRAKGWTLFSETLLDELKKNLERGEQSILFLNRRGWHTSLFCLECKKAVECPHCSAAMTFHKGESAFICHLCSYCIPPPKACPQCKQETVKYRGAGTEQVEKALYALFPEAKVLRMDADTTKEKSAYEKILKSFATGKADILIGTQMVIKGLTFPQVSLVGILNADQSLHIPDYRSAETTFQQLTQVAGRAGRGMIQGQVILQTAMPDHPVIQLAATQNYPGFYQEEIQSRKTFQFPPFQRLAKVIVKSKDEKLAKSTIEALRAFTLENISSSIEAYPVIPCPIYKISDFYRYQFLLKGPHLKSFQDWISKNKQTFLKGKNVHIKIDIDTYFS